jgi:hypothetical protein
MHAFAHQLSLGVARASGVLIGMEVFRAAGLQFPFPSSSWDAWAQCILYIAVLYSSVQLCTFISARLFPSPEAQA